MRRKNGDKGGLAVPTRATPRPNRRPLALTWRSASDWGRVEPALPCHVISGSPTQVSFCMTVLCAHTDTRPLPACLRLRSYDGVFRHHLLPEAGLCTHARARNLVKEPTMSTRFHQPSQPGMFPAPLSAGHNRPTCTMMQCNVLAEGQLLSNRLDNSIRKRIKGPFRLSRGYELSQSRKSRHGTLRVIGVDDEGPSVNGWAGSAPGMVGHACPSTNILQPDRYHSALGLAAAHPPQECNLCAFVTRTERCRHKERKGM